MNAFHSRTSLFMITDNEFETQFRYYLILFRGRKWHAAHVNVVSIRPGLILYVCLCSIQKRGQAYKTFLELWQQTTFFFFHLNLSFRSKYWLQSVIVIEKWNNPRIDRFPIRLASTSSRQRKRHCFPRSPPPGKSGTTGATVETLKKPHWWRRQSVETEVQQEWTDGHSLDGDLRCCVKVSSQADMCLSFPRGVQTVLKNRQSFY